MQIGKTLKQFAQEEARNHPEIPADIPSLLDDLAVACKYIGSLVNRAGLLDIARALDPLVLRWAR